jgi:hypothetical protein
MIYRLWFRLLLAFALVIMVTVGTVYFFVSRSMALEMQYYEKLSADYRAQQVRLVEYRLRNHWWGKGQSWDGVQAVVQEIAQVPGIRIILTDADGMVVADSQEEQMGEVYDPGERSALWNSS